MIVNYLIAFPICQRTYPKPLKGLSHVEKEVSDINGLEPFAGLEPVHLSLLNHCFKKVEDIGVEPMTPCVQGRCSSQLS